MNFYLKSMYKILCGKSKIVYVLKTYLEEKGSAVFIPVNFADGLVVYNPTLGFSPFFSSS